MKINRHLKLLVTLVLIFLIAGCTNSITPAATGTSPLAAPLVSTETKEATAIVTLEVQRNSVVIVSMNPNNVAEMENIQTLLQTYASSHNLTLQVTESIDTVEIDKVALVYLSQPAENWIDMANQNPQVKFIIQSQNVLDLPENAFQILAPKDELVFAAGYLSAIISEDWRTGAIVTDENLAGDSIENLFSNGVRFLCGLCAPVNGPIVFFPTVAVTNAQSDAAALSLAYGEIANTRLNVIYISPEFINIDFVTALKQNGLTVISQKSGDSDKGDLLDISIGYDIPAAINFLLASNLDGQIQTQKAAIEIKSQGNKITAGKKDYLNIFLTDLQEGFISPHSVAE